MRIVIAAYSHLAILLLLFLEQRKEHTRFYFQLECRGGAKPFESRPMEFI
jgi:hypothetical protein